MPSQQKFAPQQQFACSSSSSKCRTSELKKFQRAFNLKPTANESGSRVCAGNLNLQPPPPPPPQFAPCPPTPLYFASPLQFVAAPPLYQLGPDPNQLLNDLAHHRQQLEEAHMFNQRLLENIAQQQAVMEHYESANFAVTAENEKLVAQMEQMQLHMENMQEESDAKSETIRLIGATVQRHREDTVWRQSGLAAAAHDTILNLERLVPRGRSLSTDPSDALDSSAVWSDAADCSTAAL